MPKYEVSVKCIEIYAIEVEAESEEAAIAIAAEMYDEEKLDYSYHTDSDVKFEATEL